MDQAGFLKEERSITGPLSFLQQLLSREHIPLSHLRTVSLDAQFVDRFWQRRGMSG